ncbi:MAG TPA: hypothetical protein VJS64_01060 [Pyrinomonadaceae bacterium]|nr:hypothetical protein [Pyrinomonadaceae bacterium]
MRARPIRSQIYLPVVRFGVRDTDWKFVIAVVLIAYALPFFLNMRVLRFPLEIWTTIICTVVSVAFFNFVRIGRRPFWLQHQLGALLTPARLRHSLPTDRKERPWLLRDLNKG